MITEYLHFLRILLHKKMPNFNVINFTKVSSNLHPIQQQLNMSLTFSGGVSQNFGHLLVGGVLSQSTHDVSDLVVSHLVVTHPVEKTEGLLVVCRAGGEEDMITLVNPLSMLFCVSEECQQWGFHNLTVPCDAMILYNLIFLLYSLRDLKNNSAVIVITV